MSRLRTTAMMAALGLAACTADKDAIVDPAPGDDTPSFAAVQATLTRACGSCHAAGSGRTFTVAMDSAALVGSGLLNPLNPGASPLLVKARSSAHGGGNVTAFTKGDSALVAAWAALQPNVGANTLFATRTDFAPTIDGLGEALWTQAQPIVIPIGGGWAAADAVAMRALYDDHYLYIYLRWTDNQASFKRQPWIRRDDGTWLAQAAKPTPAAETEWNAYMAANAPAGGRFDPEAPQFLYEDKLALIWNTYAAATHVPEFETAGCAAACHDPSKGGKPGTTYNYARQDLAAKKYLTVQGQILDMWHWKLVRHNQQSKVDDQHVRYWAPVNDATAPSGGRAGDAGLEGYRTNPATSGRPTFKSRLTGHNNPFYAIAEVDTVRMTDAELAAMPAGTVVANVLTSPMTGNRAQIDGRGVHDNVAKVWTMEIRRRLVTGDDKDVQFDDRTRAYTFGIGVFDNAQIEHSYSGMPLSLVFKP
ncbi:MAG: hypothetical protein H0X64_02645 [Gemmatimonadaceae bacterium]|nr:hypothetical protein [Gemmatimonadaceae bacterium]